MYLSEPPNLRNELRSAPRMFTVLLLAGSTLAVFVTRCPFYWSEDGSVFLKAKVGSSKQCMDIQLSNGYTSSNLKEDQCLCPSCTRVDLGNGVRVRDQFGQRVEHPGLIYTDNVFCHETIPFRANLASFANPTDVVPFTNLMSWTDQFGNCDQPSICLAFDPLSKVNCNDHCRGGEILLNTKIPQGKNSLIFTGTLTPVSISTGTCGSFDLSSFGFTVGPRPSTDNPFTTIPSAAFAVWSQSINCRAMKINSVTICVLDDPEDAIVKSFRLTLSNQVSNNIYQFPAIIHVPSINRYAYSVAGLNGIQIQLGSTFMLGRTFCFDCSLKSISETF